MPGQRAAAERDRGPPTAKARGPVGSDCHGQARRVAAAHQHRPGAAARAHAHSTVAAEAGGDVDDAAEALEHQVALVEQAGPVAAAFAGSGEAHIDPRQLGGDHVDLVDRVAGFELRALGDRGEARGGDVELARHRLGRGRRRRRAARDRPGPSRAAAAAPSNSTIAGKMPACSTALSMFCSPASSAEARLASASVRRTSAWRNMSALRTMPAMPHARQRDVARSAAGRRRRRLPPSARCAGRSRRSRRWRCSAPSRRARCAPRGRRSRRWRGDRTPRAQPSVAEVQCAKLRLDDLGQAERPLSRGDLGEAIVLHLAEGVHRPGRRTGLRRRNRCCARRRASGAGRSPRTASRRPVRRSRSLSAGADDVARPPASRREGIGVDHITTISALSAPACFSASRIATRSDGLTPEHVQRVDDLRPARRRARTGDMAACSVDVDVLFCSTAVSPAAERRGLTDRRVLARSAR